MTELKNLPQVKNDLEEVKWAFIKSLHIKEEDMCEMKNQMSEDVNK
jgi:hypothetical protein